MAETNFRHYEPRCAHGSSLSPAMHALVAARLGDADTGASLPARTAALDLDPDPNSAGGVRIAGLGGMWQAVVFGFAGLDLMGDVLWLGPKAPTRMGEPVVPRTLAWTHRAGRHCRRHARRRRWWWARQWSCASSAADTKLAPAATLEVAL